MLLWLLHVIVPCPFVSLSFLTWSLPESGHCILLVFLQPTKTTYYSSLRFTFRLCQNHWGRGLLPWSWWPGRTEVSIHNWAVLSCHILTSPTSKANTVGRGYESVQLLTLGTRALTLYSSTGHLEYWKQGRLIFGFGFANAGQQPGRAVKRNGSPVWLSIVASIFLITFLWPPNSLASEFVMKVPSSWCLVMPHPQIPYLICSWRKALSKSGGLGFAPFLTYELSHVADHLWLFSPRWTR